jgi:MFS transporter, DHA1 family, multidrug resistance protein
VDQEGLLQLFRRYPPLLMLCVATGIIMLGQGITAPVLPLYAASFGVSVASVGLTIAAFGLARMLLNIPVGLLSDRFGRRLVLVGGPIVVAIGSLLSGTADSLWLLLVWRFLSGAGSAMYMTGATVFITDIADARSRARMMGLNQASLLAGTSMGPALGGIIAEVADFRMPFFVVAALSAICAVWAFRSIPETNTLARRTESRAADLARGSSFWRETWALMTNLPFFLISMVTLAVFLTRTGGRQTVLPLLGADEFGMSPGTIGLLFTLMSLLNLAAVPYAGSLADRFGRKAVIVPSSLVTVVSLVMFALSGSMLFLFLTGVVHGAATGFSGPAPAAYAADVAPERARGFAMGVYRTYSDIGFVVGPPLLGWLSDVGGYSGALYFNAGLVLVATALFAALAKETVGPRAPTARPVPGSSAEG